MAENDTTSGSIAYNRLDLQISQGVLFSIEHYSTCDYLMVLDYYDDLAIIETPDDPSVISYYQIKTGETITLHQVLKKQWVDKLYDHQNTEQDYIIKELGLVTSFCIKQDSETINKSIGKTATKDIAPSINTKIVDDIAKKLKILPDEVDLSKFAYIRTTLTVDAHYELSEKSFIDFVEKECGNIGISAIKAAYKTLREQFARCQRYELEKAASKERVIKHKSVSKKDITQLLLAVRSIDLPAIESLRPHVPDEHDANFSISYAKVLSDSIRYPEKLMATQTRINSLVKQNPLSKNTYWENTSYLFIIYKADYPLDIHALGSEEDLYIHVLFLIALLKTN